MTTITNTPPFRYAKSKHGEVCGQISYGCLFIRSSIVYDKSRGRGHGKALYIALIDSAFNDELRVFSDCKLSECAYRVYESLGRNYTVIKLNAGLFKPVFEVIKGDTYFFLFSKK